MRQSETRLPDFPPITAITVTRLQTIMPFLDVPSVEFSPIIEHTLVLVVMSFTISIFILSLRIYHRRRGEWILSSRSFQRTTQFSFFLFLPGFSPPFQNLYVCTGMYFTFHLITAGNDRNFIAKTKKN